MIGVALWWLCMRWKLSREQKSGLERDNWSHRRNDSSQKKCRVLSRDDKLRVKPKKKNFNDLFLFVWRVEILTFVIACDCCSHFYKVPGRCLVTSKIIDLFRSQHLNKRLALLVCTSTSAWMEETGFFCDQKLVCHLLVIILVCAWSSAASMALSTTENIVAHQRGFPTSLWRINDRVNTENKLVLM